ncbi:hypothetical protein PED39_05440 [Methanomassiliicoccales archaeon LGM-RCC1]|nr:hypothetical protein PED39_05440 [Methanomassiliicoccales archaeon LGM-RCC1]
MANTVNKVTEYLKTVMDDVIEQESKTSALQADPQIIRAANSAGTVDIATVTTTSLGDYNAGYAAANGTITWAPYALTHDRSAVFDIDRREENETGGVFSATKVAAEFMKTQVVPEIDATRIAAIVSAASAVGHVNNTYTASSQSAGIGYNRILSVLGDALDAVFDDTGKDEGLVIYMDPTAISALRNTTEISKTRELTSGQRTLDLDTMQLDGNQIVKMPKNRMYSALSYNSASSASGYSNNGVEVFFAVATPGYAQGVVAFEAPKFIAKEINQTADADRYAYRIFHDCFVPAEKRVGFYACIAKSG